MRRYLSLAVLATAASGASAQSVNVDFGSAGSSPGPGYAAAGLPGVWNTFGVLPAFERRSLIGRHGTPLEARIYQFGGTSMLSANDPATSGDDEALIDEMLLSFNNPVDACVWVENLRNGRYEVLIYAITPMNPSLMCRTTVDFANQGPAFVGGAWPGGHQLGVTYSRHTVTVTTGRIGLHSGLQGSLVQSGINGFQLRELDACPADWTDDGLVNSGDISAFLGSWLGSISEGHLIADFNGDGAINSADISGFLTAWLAAVQGGC